MGNQQCPYILGIAGPSCSGKTELAIRLAEELKRFRPIIISLDSYYKDLSHIDIYERQNHNFDSPKAIDSELLLRQLQELKNNKQIDKPLYDFELHIRKDETERIHPGNLIIVEGLFTLYNDSIRSLFNRCVYVEIDEKTALSRRLKRDINQRGRSEEFVKKQFYNQATPMAQKYVAPEKKYADLTVNGADPIKSSIKAISNIVLKDLRNLEK